MPSEVISFITHYGYLSIFIIIFSQEVGIPNPVPNELVLMFCGYLSLKGILLLPLLILVAFSADFIGTSILYGVFYFFGQKIMKYKPRWIPISEEKVNRLTERISNRGRWKIYLCRLTPFVRGYTSIIVGLLQMKPKQFLPITFLSAITWSSAYIIAGRMLGPYWSIVGNKWGNIRYIVLLAIFSIVIVILLVRYYKNHESLKSKPHG